MPTMVVSSPAESSERRRDLAGVDRSPYDRAESGGRQRLAGALGVNPRHDLCCLGHDRLEMRVARTKGIEDHGSVRQQVFYALPAEADRLGKHAQRIGLGDFSDRIDPPASDELVREFLGPFLEACAQTCHRLC